MFRFQSFLDLIKRGASWVDLDQSDRGSSPSMPIRVLFQHVRGHELARRCDHPFALQVAGIIAANCQSEVSGQRAPDPTHSFQQDHTMAKQSSYFGTAILHHDVSLKGPRPITGVEQRAEENRQALGGMRRPDKSVKTKGLYRQAGQQIQCALGNIVDTYPKLTQIVQDLRDHKIVDGIPGEIAAVARRA
eukprot:7009249-Karenia_brevis.AAC.1